MVNKLILEGNNMKLIKKVEGLQKRKNHQSELIKLENQYNHKVVYMPYGKLGSGYYLIEEEVK